MKLFTPDVELSEKDFQALLFSNSPTHPGLARQLGWGLSYHTYRSAKSPTGFPDWVLVRERVIFAELKTERGKLTAAQQEWHEGLLRAGAEAYVWRPSDLPQIAEILARRESRLVQ